MGRASATPVPNPPMILTQSPMILDESPTDSEQVPANGPVLVPFVGAPQFTSNVATLDMDRVVNDKRTFAKLLQTIVDRSGLSKREIARRLNIRENGLRQYFTGRRNRPSVYWLVRLCDICGAEVSIKFPGQR